MPLSRATCFWFAHLMFLLAAIHPGTAAAACPPLDDGGWGSQGFGPSTFNGPYGITVDESGLVYVADSNNHLISVFNPDGSLVRSWGGFGFGGGLFNFLVNVTVRDGFVYTVEFSGRIQKFTTMGTLVAGFGLPGSGPGQFFEPRGVAVAADGSIYVADTGNNRIQQFSSVGSYIREWSVSQPSDVEVGPTGQVFVLGFDGMIRRYSATGVAQVSWGGGVAGPMISPFGFDVTSSGRVYVADSVNERMIEFTSSGAVVTQWRGAFDSPRDVVRGISGRIFVADTFRHRIRRFIARDNQTCDPLPPPAGPGNGVAIMLHTRVAASGLTCEQGLPTSCAAAVTGAGLSTPDGPFYFVYLLAKIDELLTVAGLQCGVTYQNGTPGAILDQAGLDIFDWRMCGSLQFPTSSPAWPEPGSGNLITWDPDLRCQDLETAVAGYFYVGAYTADVFRLTPHPLIGQAKLANCSSSEMLVPSSRLGSVVFSAAGNVPGCNPCAVIACEQPIAVRQSTWSSIKAVLAPTLKTARAHQDRP